MKKRRHHHVWKAYLRAWAAKDKIQVLQNNRIRGADLDDVAVEKDFYKLHALTPLEIAFIKKIWIEPSPPEWRQLHDDTLFMFSVWARLKEQLTQAEASASPELAEFLDEQVHNAEEDFHAKLESQAAPLIEAARNGDISFYKDDQNAILISHFVSLQHLRTAAIRKRIVARFEKTSLPVDIARCWNVISHITAANVGFTLFADRKRRPLALLDNGTSIPFLTSDQPTVNILGGTSEDAPPEHLALYYPVSPRYALILDDAEAPSRIAEAPLTEEIVMRLNQAEVRASRRQVFADTETALAPHLLPEV
jgi:hypothetical protein